MGKANKNPQKESNQEFEHTKDAFKQILSVPKEKLDEIKKRHYLPNEIASNQPPISD